MIVPPEITGPIVMAILTSMLFGWALILRWENTHQTEARRRELESSRRAETTQAPPSLMQRAWTVAARIVMVAVPALFIIDATVGPLEWLRSPWLVYSGPFASWLQLVGIAFAGVGLAIMLWVGRKLAVEVYRKATHERDLLRTGIYAYIRHPFYLHFFLLPIGLLLLTLNGLMLLFLVAYLTMDGPTLPAKWMRDEEQELLERNGRAYADYMASTGRLLPRFRRRRRMPADQDP
jgi:protein-S-isoprenylcysteine O-methyltransferase Ste14